MTRKSTLLAAAVVTTVLAVSAGTVQAAPIASPLQSAGKIPVTLVADRHAYRGRYYHHHYRPYRHYRRYGYGWRSPAYLGAYAYEPQGGFQSYRYQPNTSTCPYYGSNNLWWCH